MQLAKEYALQLNLEYIDTEHVLVGLLKEETGVAADVLKNFGVELAKVQEEIERNSPRYTSGEPAIAGRLPHTPRVREVVSYSLEEAKARNHQVGTEDLLLGLVRPSSDGQPNIAVTILNRLYRLTPDVVRKDVLAHLGAASTNEQREKMS
ncbi:Clp protease N-terminal domain-containing protein [Fimbriiglobus ruber]|nr:Clp protease N-terminal domain-containing protein [Fimbriiglobus ruber]